MKKRKQDMFDVSLDPEERKLSQGIDHLIDRNELKGVDNLKEELLFAREAAGHYFRKNARINIRISDNDLMRLKPKAAYKGLPYQTFIASVLHEYAAGHFKKGH